VVKQLWTCPTIQFKNTQVNRKDTAILARLQHNSTEKAAAAVGDSSRYIMAVVGQHWRRREMKASLLRRIEQLEKHPRCQPPAPPTEEDRLFQTKLEQLLTEVNDKYAHLILVDFKQAKDLDQLSGLTRSFVMRVFDHFMFGMPLAFPSAVAEVYFENPSAGDSACCQQCHFRLPHSYFKFCPLCNGVVY
jgi:hypothetical protein